MRHDLEERLIETHIGRKEVKIKIGRCHKNLIESNEKLGGEELNTGFENDLRTNHFTMIKLFLRRG